APPPAHLPDTQLDCLRRDGAGSAASRAAAVFVHGEISDRRRASPDLVPGTAPLQHTRSAHVLFGPLRGGHVVLPGPNRADPLESVSLRCVRGGSVVIRARAIDRPEPEKSRAGPVGRREGAGRSLFSGRAWL